jgi:hypothetical protein
VRVAGFQDDDLTRTGALHIGLERLHVGLDRRERAVVAREDLNACTSVSIGGNVP